jgi:hypothetical protein
MNVSGHNCSFLRVHFEVSEFCSIRPTQKTWKRNSEPLFFVTEFLAVYIKFSYSSSGKSSISIELRTDFSASCFSSLMRVKCSWNKSCNHKICSIMPYFTLYDTALPNSSCFRKKKIISLRILVTIFKFQIHGSHFILRYGQVYSAALHWQAEVLQIIQNINGVR